MASLYEEEPFSWAPTKPKAATSGLSYGGAQQAPGAGFVAPGSLSLDQPLSGAGAAGMTQPGQIPGLSPSTTSGFSFDAPTPQRSSMGQMTTGTAVSRNTGLTTKMPGGISPSAGGSSVPDFSSAVAELRTLTDPAQIAQKRDKLARDLFTSLSAGGQDVKWQGDQLMINGRAYVIPGGAAASDKVYAGGSPTFNEGGGGYVAPGSLGLDQPLGGSGDQRAILRDALATQAYGPEGLWAIKDQLAQQGIELYVDSSGQIRGRAELSDGSRIDVHDQADSSGNWNVNKVGTQWGFQEMGKAGPEGPSPSALSYMSSVGSTPIASGARTVNLGGGETQVEMDQTIAAGGGGAAGGAGYSPGMVPYNGGWVPANHPLAQQAGGVPGATGPWAPGRGPSYQPGQVGFEDIPDFDFQTLFNQLTEEGGTDVQTRQAIEALLANPESLDARTVDTIKARRKGELSEMQALEDEEMQLFGEAGGLSDSPWLKSERNASRRSRDASLIDSNTDIDLQAASTRMGDRRAAAELGMSYQNARAGQKQAAASLATNATLQRAALTGDRIALRESLQQEAARLGQSADQVMSNWLTSIRDDMTKRYGIDVAKDLDLKKLSQQSQEFKDELAFRFAQLSQIDRQFGAGYGLDFARLQHEMDQDHYNRSSGGGGAGFSYS